MRSVIILLLVAAGMVHSVVDIEVWPVYQVCIPFWIMAALFFRVVDGK